MNLPESFSEEVTLSAWVIDPSLCEFASKEGFCSNKLSSIECSKSSTLLSSLLMPLCSPSEDSAEDSKGSWMWWMFKKYPIELIVSPLYLVVHWYHPTSCIPTSWRTKVWGSWLEVFGRFCSFFNHPVALIGGLASTSQPTCLKKVKEFAMSF